MVAEKFKYIKGTGKRYLISNHGRVKSLSRSTPCILKFGRTHHKSSDYHFVNVRLGKKMTNVKIHRLVAEYFVKNPNKYNEVNHIDGVKTNNYFKNLEWCTHKQNMGHASENGLYVTGEAHRSSILKSSDIGNIKRLRYDEKLPIMWIAKIYDVSYTTIHKVVHNITWKQLKSA